MRFLLLVAIFSICYVAQAQDFTPNYDESKIPDYTLPGLLTTKSGRKVKSAEQWENGRRPEILADFAREVYGKIPDGDFDVEIQKIKELKVLNGKATMKEIRMTFAKEDKSLSFDLLILLPNGKEKAPIFTGLNFYGNHTIIDLPEISIPTSWVRNNDDFFITENRATEASRGIRNNRWPVEMIIDRGYGLATIYYGDIDPDKDDFSDGVHALLYKEGQTKPASDEWGSIAG